MSVFVTWGDEDVGEDDKARKEETEGLREPPPQVREHNQSKQFGGKIDSSEDDLHQVDIHLERELRVNHGYSSTLLLFSHEEVLATWFNHC